MNEVIEVERGNKAIALFEGYKFNAYPDLKHDNITKPNESEWFYASWDKEEFDKTIKSYFKYHSSWDWQIPVWSKLVLGWYKKFVLSSRTKGNDEIYNRTMDDYAQAVRHNKPEEGFEIIVKILEWYNQNKEK